jgi:hypothetical protein
MPGAISYSLYLAHNPIKGAAFRVGYMVTGRAPSHSLTRRNARRSPPLSDQDFPVCNLLTTPLQIRLRKKPRHDLVELRELTKHTRRIPRCHTSRRDVRRDDAACTNYGAATDADAGKDDRL